MSPLARRLAALVVVVLLGLANLATQEKYVADSAGPQWERTLADARALTALPPHIPVVYGMQDAAIGQLVALYTQGHPTWNLGGFPGAPRARAPFTLWDETENGAITNDGGVMKAMIAVFAPQHFTLTPDDDQLFFRFEPPSGVDLSMAAVLLPTRAESIVNDSQDRPKAGRFYVAKLADQRDTLVQVDGSLGRLVTPGHQDDVALWQREGDFVAGGHGVQGVGNHLLFEVLGPVAGSRLLIDFSSAALAAQDHPLPSVMLRGATEQTMTFGGRGAGRLVSDPIEPREIGGHYYIAIDLDQAIAHFGGADSRGLVGFVRNISLLTPEQAAALQPPSAVASLPAGLQAPGLRYGGVSEDGWVADKVWFELATAETSDRLRIKGDVPGIGAKLAQGVVTIRVDGEAVGEAKLKPGALDLTLPVAPKSGDRRIELDASVSDRLPKPDNRLVAFHLASVALERQP